jgi:mannosyl-oligosaccharide glucosidase
VLGFVLLGFNADYTPVLLFTQMKKAVDEAIQKYGAENPPPPAQVFTVNNSPGDGNVQLVQKVFSGAFEVCRIMISFVW